MKKIDDMTREELLVLTPVEIAGPWGCAEGPLFGANQELLREKLPEIRETYERLKAHRETGGSPTDPSIRAAVDAQTDIVIVETWSLASKPGLDHYREVKWYHEALVHRILNVYGPSNRGG